MPNAKTRSRLSHAAAAGVKDLPSNTAWLIGKAWQPTAKEIPEKVNHLGDRFSEVAHAAAESAGPSMAGARRTASVAGKLIADVVPRIGQDTVADMMRRSDDAAEHAHEAEATAVRLAQRAKDEADAAAGIAAESDHAVEQARKEAEQMVATRVERAQQAADEQVVVLEQELREKLRRAQEHNVQQLSQLRQEEEATARKALEKIEEQTTSRVNQAKMRAENSQEEAAEAIQRANKALGVAQQFADEAAQAAQAAAAEATREAEKLAARAKVQASEAKRRAVEADRVRDRAGKSAARVSGNGQPMSAAMTATLPNLTASDLDVLAKQDLLRIAQALDVEGRASMTKPDLLEALEGEGVSPTNLTKRELLDLGESWGLEVRASMSKAELVKLIDSQSGE